MLNATMQDDFLLLELDDGKVNALDLELLLAVIATFGEAPAELPVVLTGAGRAFSAGVDLRRILLGGSEYTTRFLDALSACFLAVFDHPSPVIAAVNGPAVAGGCVLAAACDRRLISRGPIGLAELAVGVPFPTAAVEIMRGVLGSNLSALVLDAQMLEPQDALAVGLVDEIVAHDNLLGRAVELAAIWNALPAGVFTHTKRQLQGPVRARIADRAVTDDAVMHELWRSSALRGAMTQHMEKLAQPRQ